MAAIPHEHSIRERISAAGQGHVFRFWDALRPEERSALLADLGSIDLDWLASMAALASTGGKAAPANISPAPCLWLESKDFPYRLDAQARDAVSHGEAALRAGEVAALLVAGGQGTRLGYDKPKGLYPLYPLSGKSLFEGFAAQLRAARERWGHPVPLYVMTSSATHDDTLAAFEHANHYGLDAQDVRFFQQANVPALAASGKLILEDKHRLALSPDGHGGCLAALARSGCLDDMRSRGLRWISYFQVDNPMVRAADPAFIGLAATRNADAGTKAVRKEEPGEKVGVVALRDGRPGVVEYSELSAQQAAARDGDGRLLFGAGNTAIHVFRVEFLAALAGQTRGLPWHLAHKAVPFVDDAGRRVTPPGPNAFKFEQFIFDVLPLARETFTLEVPRRGEFLPVKSASGPASPDAVREEMAHEWRDMLALHGVAVPADCGVEIAPSLTNDDAALTAFVAKRREQLRDAARPGGSVMVSDEFWR